jgi:anti-sigma-K factor RskA
MMDDKADEEQDRLDLTPLDPRADAPRFDRLMREVRRGATPELVRRQFSSTLWGQIARWRRPILATSGVVALVSVIALVVAHPSTRTSATTSATTQTTLAEAFGVPSSVARWVQGSDKPTTGDLLGLERGAQ